MRALFVATALALAAAEPGGAADTIAYDAEQHALDFMAHSYAAGKGNLVLVRGLVQRGAPVDAPAFSPDSDAQYLASQFTSPLQAASEAGHLDVVAFLLEEGANPDWQCCSGETALYLAAVSGHRDVAEALLRAGANPSLSAISGSPLDAAQAAGHTEIVAILSRAAAKPD